MTTNYIQQKEAGLKARFSLLPKALRKGKNGLDRPRIHKGGLELTRQENFVSGAQDIFDLLDQNRLEKDGLKRTIGTAITILGNARRMIENAERKIARQNRHIKELEEQATTDKLTGLLNRQGFFQAFARELGRTDRGHNEGGLLVLIGVDNFKAINHLHGAKASDTCLRLVANALKNEIRDMDIGARIDTDEFVLLFSNTNKDQALERAQKLALRLNNLSFIRGGTEIRVSVSLGLKSYGPGDTVYNIFQKADKERYLDKKGKET